MFGKYKRDDIINLKNCIMKGLTDGEAFIANITSEQSSRLSSIIAESAQALYDVLSRKTPEPFQEIQQAWLDYQKFQNAQKDITYKFDVNDQVVFLHKRATIKNRRMGKTEPLYTFQFEGEDWTIGESALQKAVEIPFKFNVGQTVITDIRKDRGIIISREMGLINANGNSYAVMFVIKTAEGDRYYTKYYGETSLIDASEYDSQNAFKFNVGDIVKYASMSVTITSRKLGILGPCYTIDVHNVDSDHYKSWLLHESYFTKA